MSDESEDETGNVFEADCCNGIVGVIVVVVPFCGGDNNDGKEDVDGRVAAIGAGAFCVSAGAVCVSNSGGGTWACNFLHWESLIRITGRTFGVACTLVISLARSQ